MDRRTFNKLAGYGTLASLSPMGLGSAAAAQSVKALSDNPVPWPSKAYRRFLADMHVPDWSPVLMSRFDPEDFVRTVVVVEAGFESMVMFANSHVGLALWQTQIGHVHGNMKGHDWFGEVVEQCHKQRIDVVGYFSLIFDNWHYQNHPDWRMLPDAGYDLTLQGRYGTVCPNSPYRNYAKACLKEIAGNYDISGLFLDMTFWPSVCYCPHCTARYWKEHHAEPPRVADWNDPKWRLFQQAREQWMLEFAEEVTKAIKGARPIPVMHNLSVAFHNWHSAAPIQINKACDFAAGDFYGGPTQFSIVCKAFDGLTRTHPFEFMTSVPYNLLSRISYKPFDELVRDSFIPTVHCAAVRLIDGINPDGTLHKPLYKNLAKINALHAPYEPYMGGELLADVAIYIDKASMYNPDIDGKRIGDFEEAFPAALEGPIPHLDAVVGVAEALRAAHVPYSVVTNANLEQLKRYRAVILPSVLELTEEQAAKFREFVKAGGVLYASAPTSLDRMAPNGPRLLLSDVLGIHYLGTLGTELTYFYPTSESLKRTAWPQNYLYYQGPMMKVEAMPGAEVLARATLPYVPPESRHVIGSHFVDIHSSHPAQEPGTNPAIVLHSYGKGKTVWLAAPLELGAKHKEKAKFVLAALREALSGPYYFEADTHPSVEMTLFHQKEHKRYLAGLLNMEANDPAPVGATARVRLPEGRRATRVRLLPKGETVAFEKSGPYIKFTLKPFSRIAMALIEYD